MDANLSMMTLFLNFVKYDLVIKYKSLVSHWYCSYPVRISVIWTSSQNEAVASHLLN